MPGTKKANSQVLRDQQLINDYMEATGAEDIDMRAVVRWAKANGRDEPPEYDPDRAYAQRLSKAAQQEHYRDPQNRSVRKKHCYVIVDEEGQRRWHWIDIETGKPDKVHLCFQQRRQSAFRDVVQLKTDLDSYNDNNKHGAQLTMSFNFDEDLSELAESDKYPDGPGGEDGDDQF